MPQTPSKEEMEAALAQLGRVREAWLNRPNVTAVDVGYKIRDGRMTDELAVRVHVRRKLPMEELRPEEVFSHGDETDTLGDVPIDVIESNFEPQPLASGPGLAPESAERRGWVDPMVGGVSVANARVTAGTLSTVVWDRSDFRPCLLSNWHVLAGSRFAVPGEAILQPGFLDGGTYGATVGRLKRWRLDEHADVALASLDGLRGYSRDILGLGPVTGMEPPALGMELVKSGRTTGITEGMIDGVGMSLVLTYETGLSVSFHDQIHIVPSAGAGPSVVLSAGGDSGSLWIEKGTGKAVGLHFAGSTGFLPGSQSAVANRILQVAELLGFSFFPLFLPMPDAEVRLRGAVREIMTRHRPGLGAPPGIARADSVGPTVRGASTAPSAAPAGELEALVDEIMAAVRGAG